MPNLFDADGIDPAEPAMDKEAVSEDFVFRRDAIGRLYKYDLYGNRI